MQGSCAGAGQVLSGIFTARGAHPAHVGPLAAQAVYAALPLESHLRQGWVSLAIPSLSSLTVHIPLKFRIVTSSACKAEMAWRW